MLNLVSYSLSLQYWQWYSVVNFRAIPYFSDSEVSFEEVSDGKDLVEDNDSTDDEEGRRINIEENDSIDDEFTYFPPNIFFCFSLLKKITSY